MTRLFLITFIHHFPFARSKGTLSPYSLRVRRVAVSGTADQRSMGLVAHVDSIHHNPSPASWLN